MDSPGRRHKRNILIAVTSEETSREDVLDALRCAASLKEALQDIYNPIIFSVTRQDFKDKTKLEKRILSFSPVCIFNIFEGFSDDAEKEVEFIDFLENTGLPFTGNPLSAAYACLDKDMVKRILRRAGIPVPKGVLVRGLKDIDAYGLVFPLFIKPVKEDASVGIENDSLVFDRKQLMRVVKNRLTRFPQGVIVEEFIEGCEYNAGFLGAAHFEMMGVSVIDYKKYNKFKPFLSYSAKWNTKSGEFKAIIPSCKEKLDKQLRASIINISKKAAGALGCRGYFRVDLRERNGKLYVLDVNPNPDINVDSGFIRQAACKGYTFTKIVKRIVKIALTVFKQGERHDNHRCKCSDSDCSHHASIYHPRDRGSARSPGKKHFSK